MSTPPTMPPQQPSNEATDEQLDVARVEGDAYGKALDAMAQEDGACVARAGDYLVAFVNEEAEGMYELVDGELVWREAAPDANVHLEVAVADAGDGRFVPGLSVHVRLDRGEETVLATDLPFLWHPFLHHYGGNARLPDPGPYEVSVRIEPPSYMRHDPVNGRRYATVVDARFPGVRMASGRKPSPEASPRGQDAPTAMPAG